MKLKSNTTMVVIVTSHPSRGAWIEIGGRRHLDWSTMVAPLTGCVD